MGRSRGEESGSQEDLELDNVSNSIDSRLKEELDRATSGSDHKQRTILSAAIEYILTLDGDGRVVVDEDKIGEELEFYGELYK